MKFYLVDLLGQVLSTLLGCVIMEHEGLMEHKDDKYRESFVLHLIGMILVCI